MRAFVFGGADIKDYSFCQKYIENSFIVCCDAGMKHAKELGITPNVIVGDFDSVDENTLKYYKSNVFITDIVLKKKKKVC